jgi:hypothetical protein
VTRAFMYRELTLCILFLPFSSILICLLNQVKILKNFFQKKFDIYTKHSKNKKIAYTFQISDPKFCNTPNLYCISTRFFSVLVNFMGQYGCIHMDLPLFHKQPPTKFKIHMSLYPFNLSIYNYYHSANLYLPIISTTKFYPIY